MPVGLSARLQIKENLINLCEEALQYYTLYVSRKFGKGSSGLLIAQSEKVS